MLSHLYINNYALISELDISFSSGFSCMTGETGAGKSIILGALGLLTGNRADSRSISDGKQKCVIEAEFSEIDFSMLKDIFEANELDYADSVILRRELTPTKSRAFVNDTPVGLGVLKEIAEQLIDIHSQHQNLLLQDDGFQLKIVDSIAQNTTIRQTYQVCYNAYKATKHHLEQTKEEAQKASEEADYIAFQYRQLDELQLKEGEQQELENEQEWLSNAENIKTALNISQDILSSDETGVISMIKKVVGEIRHIEKYLKDDNIAERLDESYIEIRDIAEEIARKADNTEYNPQRLQQINERLDAINSMLMKHHKQTVEELISLRDEYHRKMLHIESFDADINRLEQELRKQEKQLQELSSALTASRQAQLDNISQQLRHDLSHLGIANAKVEWEYKELSAYTPQGKDSITLLFAANKNQILRPAKEVASGGEIARLMLCIKAMMAAGDGLPTIIFDEIDTGVSGEVAQNMGQMMLRMGRKRQIITITHLPQIAAKGEQHYKVYKQDNDERTETHIKQLNDDERLQEIATMLSGHNITAAALENARELIKAKV